jgi:site-specific recombinase XerD
VENNLPMISRRALRNVYDKARAPKFLAPAQIRLILDYEYNRNTKEQRERRNLNKYYVLFSLLWNTGARISEALSLVVDDVKPDKQIYFKTLKRGKDASRYVPINEAMFEILSRYRQEQNLVGSSLLFDISPVAVHKELKKACRAVGLPSWVHVHTFRHSFAVNCLTQGVLITALKDLLGHESLESTLVYTRVFQPQIREQLSKVQF